MDDSSLIYNRIAKYFSDTRAYLWADFYIPELVSILKPGMKVLDVGCGNGRLSQFLLDKNIDYTGLDQSGELIHIAREKFPSLSFAVGEMTLLPFADHVFDAVYCIAAFHHLMTHEQQLCGLGEFRRVLKPGGKLVMTNWNLLGGWGQNKIANGNWKTGTTLKEVLVPWKTPEGVSLGDRAYYAFTLSELENLFAQVGFVVEEQFYIKKGRRSTPEEGENILSICLVGD